MIKKGYSVLFWQILLFKYIHFVWILKLNLFLDFVVFNKPNKLTKKYFRHETSQILVFWELPTKNTVLRNSTTDVTFSFSQEGQPFILMLIVLLISCCVKPWEIKERYSTYSSSPNKRVDWNKYVGGNCCS